jgi:hypothetical protein
VGGGGFRSEKDIKISFRVTEHEGRKWVLLAKGRFQKQEFGNIVITLPVAKSSEMFVTSRLTTIFLRNSYSSHCHSAHRARRLSKRTASPHSQLRRHHFPLLLPHPETNHAPVTLLASVMFSENQSTPTPFRT